MIYPLLQALVSALRCIRTPGVIQRIGKKSCRWTISSDRVQLRDTEAVFIVYGPPYTMCGRTSITRISLRDEREFKIISFCNALRQLKGKDIRKWTHLSCHQGNRNRNRGNSSLVVGFAGPHIS